MSPTNKPKEGLISMSYLRKTLVALLLMVSTTAAAPVILGVEDIDFDHGVEIDISGTGFGIKSPAEPIKWETWEGDTDPNPANHFTPVSNTLLRLSQPEWQFYSGGGRTQGARYWGNESYNGLFCASNQEAFKSTGGGGIETNFLDLNPSLMKTFQSYKFMVSGPPFPPVETGAIDQVKLGRFASNEAPGGWRYGGPGRSSVSGWRFSKAVPEEFHFEGIRGGPGQVHNNPDKLEEWDGRFGPTGQVGHWFTIEQYRELSDPGVVNGLEHASTYRPTGRTAGITVKEITVDNRIAGDLWKTDTVLLGLMYANAASSYDINIFVDDIYIDNTQARIVLGDVATFSQCRVREMQYPTSWSLGNASFIINTGRFNSGDTAYLFLVDSNGSVNNPGKDIVIGDPGGGLLCDDGLPPPPGGCVDATMIAPTGLTATGGN